MKQPLEVSNHPEKTVLWAVCLMAFFGFFQLGELLLNWEADFNCSLHLAWGNVAVDDIQSSIMAQVHLKKSKTGQFGQGADVILGKTGQELCPVAATLSYTELRGPQPGPFFLTRDN